MEFNYLKISDWFLISMLVWRLALFQVDKGFIGLSSSNHPVRKSSNFMQFPTSPPFSWQLSISVCWQILIKFDTHNCDVLTLIDRKKKPEMWMQFSERFWKFLLVQNEGTSSKKSVGQRVCLKFYNPSLLPSTVLSNEVKLSLLLTCLMYAAWPKIPRRVANSLLLLTERRLKKPEPRSEKV